MSSSDSSLEDSGIWLGSCRGVMSSILVSKVTVAPPMPDSAGVVSLML